MNFEDLATKQDLQELKTILLQALDKQRSNEKKEWLRTKDVKKILHLSDGSLANLRVKKLLNPSKIEGVYYYKLSEIEALLENK